MASLFAGFLVEKYVTCQSRKSDFGLYRFRFSPCLIRKWVAKSEAILALLARTKPNTIFFIVLIYFENCFYCIWK